MYQAVFSLPDLLLIFACFGGLFLAVVSWVNTYPLTCSVRLVICFFICVAMTMALKLVLWVPGLAQWREDYDGIVTFLYVSVSFLKGGLLYLYLTSITQSHFSFTKKRVAVFVAPFILALLYVALGFDAAALTQKFDFTTAAVFTGFSAIVIFPWGVSLWCLSRLANARVLLEAYTSEDSYLARQWLTLLVWVFIITWSWEVITHFVSGPLSMVTFTELPHYFGVFHDVIAALSTTFLYVYSSSMAFKTLNRARLFSEEKSVEQSVVEPLMSAELVEKMLAKSLHLEKNLNIERFSETLDLRARRVSQIINDELAMSFSEFINFYRVEYAKKRLMSRNFVSIQDVWDNSGFNSESSFYRIFKSVTGVSPSRYRKGGQIIISATNA